jgi:tetratricopeptide (TPR) repeat protein
VDNYYSALLVDPNHADAYNKRGNAFAKLGELKRALGDFDQALRLNPLVHQLS